MLEDRRMDAVVKRLLREGRWKELLSKGYTLSEAKRLSWILYPCKKNWPTARRLTGIKPNEIVEQPSTPDIHETEPEIVKHSSSPGKCETGTEPEETKIVTSLPMCPSSPGTKSVELKNVTPFCKVPNNQDFTENLKDN